MPKLKDSEVLWIYSMGKRLRVHAIYSNDADANRAMERDDKLAVIAVAGGFVFLADKYDTGEPLKSEAQERAEAAGLQVRHDVHGFYILSDDEAEFEDAGPNGSVGFDGRPHYATEAEAWEAAATQGEG